MTIQEQKQSMVYKTLVFNENVGKAQDPNKKLQLPFELEDTYKQIYIIDKKVFKKYMNSRDLDGQFQRIPPIINHDNFSDKNILDYEVWTPQRVGTPAIKDFIKMILQKQEDQSITRNRYKRVGKTNKFLLMKPQILTIPTEDVALIPTDDKDMLGMPVLNSMMGMASPNSMMGMKSGGKKVRKHKGIIQIGGNKGKLRKGYRYSGKKLKNGLPQIIKVKK